MSRQAPPAFVAAMQDHNNARQNKVDDEEDDYMSMVIEEPKAQRETLTQRKLRKQREVRSTKPSVPPTRSTTSAPFSRVHLLIRPLCADLALRDSLRIYAYIVRDIF